MSEKKSMGKGLRIILRILGIIAVIAVVFLETITVREYKPKDIESLEIVSGETKTLNKGQDLRIVSWNIGYGALGDNADFFMDGGTSVTTADETKVRENLDGILTTLNSINADIVLMQEVDRCSTRSYKINEMAYLKEHLSGQGVFASNFLVDFVPYPIPPIGKVDSGILTLSDYTVKEASRIQLPIPFSWPTSTCNLKRCISVSRLPIEDSENQLVLVNLHLEAYDDGEGKKAQADMLRAILEEEASKGNYVIAGGDFNQTFSNIGLEKFPIQEGMWAPSVMELTEFEGGLSFLMDPDTPSCRSLDKAYVGADHDSFQYYLIDGFIVSENVEVKSYSVLAEEFQYSDHNPFVMEVSLK